MTRSGCGHGHFGAWAAALAVVGGCSEVLDFGEVCVPPQLRFTLAVNTPATVGGPGCAGGGAIRGWLLVPGEPPVELVESAGALRGALVYVTTDSTLPVLIAFGVVPPGAAEEGGPVMVAYEVAAVDLRGVSCGARVEVDPEQTVLVAEPESLESLAQLAPGLPDPQGVDWAHAMITSAAPASTAPLDRDDDGCSNLEELCAGTLFVPGAPCD